MESAIPVTGVPVEPRTERFMIEKISDVGWFVCIFGCFVCPPFNLFGLCMKETIVVEIPCTDV